jgi:hypothetical protein
MNRAEAIAAAVAPVSCKYGAPMGRRDQLPDDGERLWVTRLPFIDGDYDRGGAYWGAPDNLYVAVGPQGARLYVRAASRLYAQMILREAHGDGLRFYREARS